MKENDQKTLHQTARRYERLVSSITDYIYTVEVANSLPGRITGILDCKSGNASLIGYGPEDFASNPDLINAMVHEEDRYDADKQVRNLLTRGLTSTIEHRVAHKDGSVRWIKKTLVPQYDERGVLTAYDGLISYITRQKEAESRLILSEKMSSLGILSAGVAHEIKNPLAIILQGIEFLEISAPEKGASDVLSMMKEAVFRAGRITRDLLTFSRENAYEFVEIDLCQIITETLSFVDHIFSLKQIKIVRNFPDGLPKVKADPNQIKQVFINLLTNSAEAMPEGGTITIDAHVAENIRKEKIIQVIIVDTGPGISEEDRERVFDPFYTTKKKSGGTGLGLSVVKGIIEKHKGDIKMQNEPGKGAKVTIELPCYGIK